MAWFDPPLHKPGNKKCPSCGNPVGWAAMWWWFNGSSTFLCSRCGAQLKVAIGRSILGLVLCAACYALWLWIMSFGWGYAVLLTYVGILFWILAQWWFTSVRLSEKVPLEQAEWRNLPLYKPGNKRCPNCGSPVRRESIGPFWSTRCCTQCGAPLRQHRGRAIVGLVAGTTVVATFSALLFWSIFDDEALRKWVLMLLPLWWFLLIVFNQWWSVSVRLDEKALSKPGSP